MKFGWNNNALKEAKLFPEHKEGSSKALKLLQLQLQSQISPVSLNLNNSFGVSLKTGEAFRSLADLNGLLNHFGDIGVRQIYL